MSPVPSGHPDFASEADTASGRSSVPFTHPRRHHSGPVELGAVALARVRESASRNGAAAEMFASGRHEEATALFEQALLSCRSTLGGEHPDTLRVAGNLGVAYVASGNRRKGIKLITNNVATRVRVLGEDHPDTLTALNALAAAHRMSGDAETAVSLAKLAVVGRSRTLGPTHPDTLTARMGLVLALADTGDVSSAYRLLGATVADAEEALGPEHRHTRTLIECGASHGLLRREA